MKVRGKWYSSVGFLAVGQLDDDVLEGQQYPRVDLEGQVQVQRAVAALLGMQIDLPRLSQRVGLHEMSLVVHVEPVVDGVVLELGYVSGDIDDRHSTNPTCARTASRVGYRRRCGVLRGLGSSPRPAMSSRCCTKWSSAVADSLEGLDDWGLAGTRDGQYRSDLVADRAALAVIDRAGYGALSEESGLHATDRPVWVVLDPVDGSTNASRRPALVGHQRVRPRCRRPSGGGGRQSSHRDALRGDSGRRGSCRRPTRSRRLRATSMRRRHRGTVGVFPTLAGLVPVPGVGAAALDLCAVASGQVDAFIDCARQSLAPWDYLGGVLICQEAGAVVQEAFGRDLVVREPGPAADTGGGGHARLARGGGRGQAQLGERGEVGDLGRFSLARPVAGSLDPGRHATVRGVGPLIRLRVSLADRPGALAGVATIIASRGGNITSVDVQRVDGEFVVDDLVVQFSEPPDVVLLRDDLAANGAATVLSHQETQAIDPIVASLRRIMQLVDSWPGDPATAARRRSSRIVLVPRGVDQQPG